MKYINGKMKKQIYELGIAKVINDVYPKKRKDIAKTWIICLIANIIIAILFRLVAIPPFLSYLFPGFGYIKWILFALIISTIPIMMAHIAWPKDKIVSSAHGLKMLHEYYGDILGEIQLDFAPNLPVHETPALPPRDNGSYITKNWYILDGPYFTSFIKITDIVAVVAGERTSILTVCGDKDAYEWIPYGPLYRNQYWNYTFNLLLNANPFILSNEDSISLNGEKIDVQTAYYQGEYDAIIKEFFARKSGA